jgi:hypothetical protein
MRTTKKEGAQREGGAIPSGDVVAAAFTSGVVPRWLVDEMLLHLEPWPEGEAPPWSVVERYLADGSFSQRIEAYAASAPPFADVLRALRNEEAARCAGRVPPPHLRRIK